MVFSPGRLIPLGPLSASSCPLSIEGLEAIKRGQMIEVLVTDEYRINDQHVLRATEPFLNHPMAHLLALALHIWDIAIAPLLECGDLILMPVELHTNAGHWCRIHV